MTITERSFLKLAVIAASMLLLLGIAGCGSDETPKSAAPGASSSSSAKADKSDSKGPVSSSEHEQFEKRYTEICVKSEQADPGSTIKDDQELGRFCGCMAKAISGRISKGDAVHFLKKNEFPIDLVMMTNTASITCGKKQ